MRRGASMRFERQTNKRERAHAAEVLAASELRLFRRTVAGLAVVMAVAGHGRGLAVACCAHPAPACRSQTNRRRCRRRIRWCPDFAYKFRYTVGVPIGLVEDILERVNKFQEQLGEVSPHILQQSKADAQGELASTLLALGATGRALDRAREAWGIYRRFLCRRRRATTVFNSACRGAASGSATPCWRAAIYLTLTMPIARASISQRNSTARMSPMPTGSMIFPKPTTSSATFWWRKARSTTPARCIKTAWMWPRFRSAVTATSYVGRATSHGATVR